MRAWVAGSAAVLGALTVAGPADAQSDAPFGPGTKILPPISYRQLSVFPIVKADTRHVDAHEYLSLSQGLKEKLVKVTEAGGGGEVNQVMVHNSSAKPLLLLGGEMILGGQQDRIMGQDTIVAAGRTLSVGVFCVESGRWSGHQSFDGTGGIAESRVRMSAKFKSDQSAVWNEVAERNKSLGAENETSTYRKLATGPEGEAAIRPYQENIAAPLAKMPQADKIVGVAAAISGQVVSVDVFDSPALFARYKEGLLHGIFVSAAAAPEPSAAAPAAPPPAPAAVTEFVSQADAAPEKTVTKAGQARTTVKNTGKVARSAVISHDGAGDKSVYQSYQAE